MGEEKCCGSCVHNEYNTVYRMFVCANAESDSYGCATSYDDVCEDYEED